MTGAKTIVLAAATAAATATLLTAGILTVGTRLMPQPEDPQTKFCTSMLMQLSKDSGMQPSLSEARAACKDATKEVQNLMEDLFRMKP